MDRVHVGKNLVRYSNGQPVPPMRVIGPVQVIARLRSTRTGTGARWWVETPEGEIEQPFRLSRLVLGINDAPREPMARMVAERFVWAPPDTRDCPVPPDFEELVRDGHSYLVVQRGSLVPNWAALVIGPIYDPVCEAIVRLIDEFRFDWEQVTAQGNLSIFRLDEEIPDSRLTFLHRGSGNRRLLNHWIIGHAGFAYRVIDGYCQAILRVRKGSSCLVLSPDHPDNPVELAAGEHDRVFYLSIPFPRRDRN